MSATICYLLFETTTNNYKIGQSKNVWSRFQSHLTSNINLELIGISLKSESDLHKEFSEFRLQREWFNLCECEESKNKLLSYFVEFSKPNVGKINTKLREVNPPSEKHPLRHIGEQKPEKKVESISSWEPYSERSNIGFNNSTENGSKHAYHMRMKYGGGRW